MHLPGRQYSVPIKTLIDHCRVLHEDMEINWELIKDLQADDDTDFRRTVFRIIWVEERVSHEQ